MSHVKRLAFLFALLTLTIVGCRPETSSSLATPSSTDTPAVSVPPSTSSPTPTLTPTPVPTFTRTPTPVPSPTLQPTVTLKPTAMLPEARASCDYDRILASLEDRLALDDFSVERSVHCSRLQKTTFTSYRVMASSYKLA